MSDRTNESWASVTARGKVSAQYWRNDENGNQYAVAEVGGMKLFLPFSQAVALHADLTDALAGFDHRTATMSEFFGGHDDVPF